MMKFDITIITTVGIVDMTIFAVNGAEAEQRASDYAYSRGMEVEDILYVGYRV